MGFENCSDFHAKVFHKTYVHQVQYISSVGDWNTCNIFASTQNNPVQGFMWTKSFMVSYPHIKDKGGQRDLKVKRWHGHETFRVIKCHENMVLFHFL